MAKNDKYLKSEGLNVKKGGNSSKHRSPKNQQDNKAVEKESENSQSPLDSLTRYREVLVSSSNVFVLGKNENCSNREKTNIDLENPTITQGDNQTDYRFHDSVGALMQVDATNKTQIQNGTNNDDNENKYMLFCEKGERSNTSIGALNTFDEYNSSEEDSYDSSMKDVNSRINNRSNRKNEEIINKNSREQKDPNRFIMDLNARFAFKDEGLDSFERQQQKSTLSQQSKSKGSFLGILEVFVRSENKIDLLRNVVKEDFTNVIVNHSYRKYKVHSQDNKYGNGMEDYQRENERIDEVVSSSLDLDINEAMELERLQKEIKSDSDLGNRYILYILIPFLLTTVVYFMTRKTTDDSVT